jgi:hypothetical protein
MSERTDRYWDCDEAAWVPSPPRPEAELPSQRTAVEEVEEADVRS